LPSAAGTTTYFAVDDCGAGVDQAAASLAIFLKSLIQSCPRREYPDVVVGEAELEAIAVERDLVNPTRPGRKNQAGRKGTAKSSGGVQLEKTQADKKASGSGTAGLGAGWIECRVHRHDISPP
jgi:hypothetical protein